MGKTGLSPGDPNSFSRPDHVAVVDMHLSLDIDFKKNVLAGEVHLTVEHKQDGNQSVILDAKDLTIKEVKSLENGQTLQYTLGEPVQTFGSKMEISLPSTDAKRFVVSVKYETAPSASALQWLKPEQTAQGKHPFVFSQCQAIHCRSMVPCQDTPSVKAPYTAEITAPAELTVLMSAVREGEPQMKGKDIKIHKFRQKVPVPAYLIALVAGDLQSKKLGPRSHVWAEKEFIEQAAYDFAETEKMLSTAEELCGPYVWGVYDLLVLPPSFPFGGMENPCLTFITPTILTGDRSLADVVAHEISHSWTGNLVTNRNFEHFWLNEGFTMFVERKILGRMLGEKHRQFCAIGGLKDLADTIESRGADDPLTCLIPDLKGVDPDDSFSTVPYEKGHTLLYYLEELVGGPDAFEPFLKAYLDKYKYKSIDSDDFKSFLYSYFASNEKLKAVDWEAWFHKPGMPPVIPKYDRTLAEACVNLCHKWVKWNHTSEKCPCGSADLKSMSPLQVREFLSELLEAKPLELEKVKKMEELYKLNSYTNSEIKCRWLRLCIKAQWKEQVPRALSFVTEQGRMKFVRPIYRDLYKWAETREQAIVTYKKHKPQMMYVAAYTVAKDLQLEP